MIFKEVPLLYWFPFFGMGVVFVWHGWIKLEVSGHRDLLFAEEGLLLNGM
jgi:hypothetical protein